jgi:polyisoprenoid-binding protein YceI
MAQWHIDPAHTNAEFIVTHMMFSKVRGRFTDVSGTIDYNADDISASSVSATINVASVDSGAQDRDNHLRSADFFDVENYPQIKFRSTEVIGKGEGKATIKGDLTIRDTTRPVSFEAEFLGSGANPWGMQVAGFNGSLKVNREDFGLTWNQVLETGGVLVSKEVEIVLNVQAILQTEDEAQTTA